MRFLQATQVFVNNEHLQENVIVVLNSKQVIVDVLSAEQDTIDPLKLEKLNGILCPGFINTHCHLELSHLKGKIPEGTGIVDFAKNIITQRNKASQEEMIASMQLAEKEMISKGIVAVGDISNHEISIQVKRNKNIYYHTFVELIGLNPEKAGLLIEPGKELIRLFSQNALTASLSPHAPYSVSGKLMQLIADFNSAANACSAIHNQESEAENEFMHSKTGDFISLYKFLNLPLPFFNGSNLSSLKTYLPYLLNTEKLLLVHNTFSSKADIQWANSLSSQLFWCLCPNANLYIEGRLPAIPLLRTMNCKVTIGTDSLASNHQLSVWNELQLISRHFPEIPLTELLQWACYNGALFLGKEESLGSIAIGKQPGLNLICLDKNDASIAKAAVKKIA